MLYAMSLFFHLRRALKRLFETLRWAKQDYLDGLLKVGPDGLLSFDLYSLFTHDWFDLVHRPRYWLLELVKLYPDRRRF